jgi:hypothetical protein
LISVITSEFFSPAEHACFFEADFGGIATTRPIPEIMKVFGCGHVRLCFSCMAVLRVTEQVQKNRLVTVWQTSSEWHNRLKIKVF